jgi:hypothetical protein
MINKHFVNKQRRKTITKLIKIACDYFIIYKHGCARTGFITHYNWLDKMEQSKYRLQRSNRITRVHRGWTAKVKLFRV